MTQLVRVTIDERVATCQLTRPEKKNAMDPELHEQMLDALTGLETEDLSVLVLTGEGDSFCAGMDLNRCFFEPWDDPDEFFRINESTAYAWFRRLKHFPAVTVAKINGFAFGGGVELVGLCDLAVAAEEARFGLSEINFGTFPGGGTMWAVAHNLSRKEALYRMLTGEPFDGRKAVEIGLVNVAVPLVQLDEEVDRLVEQLSRKSRHTLRAVKHVYEQSVRMTLDESIDWETARLFQLAYQARDEWVDHGIQQFKERRYKPGETGFEVQDSV